VEFRLLEEGVDEVIILASDGLWDVVNNEDALRIYYEGGKGEKGALALVQVGNSWFSLAQPRALLSSVVLSLFGCWGAQIWHMY